jgi:hypothetical protein
MSTANGRETAAQMRPTKLTRAGIQPAPADRFNRFGTQYMDSVAAAASVPGEAKPVLA